MRFLLGMLMIGAFSLSSFGQKTKDTDESCSNSSVQEISSRGIKLGTKIEEIVSLFATTDEEKKQILNRSASPDKEFGYESFSASPKPNDTRFFGVTSYSFDFLDGILEGFSVSYPKPKWLSVDQFRDKLAESFPLPKIENWKRESENRIKTECSNYALSLNIVNDFVRSNNYFIVTNTRVKTILAGRRREAEATQREKDLKIFKP